MDANIAGECSQHCTDKQPCTLCQGRLKAEQESDDAAHDLLIWLGEEPDKPL